MFGKGDISDGRAGKKIAEGYSAIGKNLDDLKEKLSKNGVSIKKQGEMLIVERVGPMAYEGIYSKNQGVVYSINGKMQKRGEEVVGLDRAIMDILEVEYPSRLKYFS